jgi:CDP-glycerol glycerophosphotransferase (TagB/SpsB family)
MILPQLIGRGLFVFSDPGGAKPLLSYVKLNRLEEKTYLISDRYYPFYKDFELEVNLINELSPKQILEKENPDYLITGTSYTSKIELKFLKAAKEKGTVTYSFVDHYTKFLERFMISDTEMIFPDQILVMDQKAYDFGTAFNIGVDIVITGNFYHEYLKKWVPQINRNQFRDSLNISPHQKVVLFAPDPLSNVGGKEVYGFDEESVFKNIEKVLLHQKTNNFVFVVALHPNQNRNYLLPGLRESNVKIIINEEFDVNHLIYYADVVVSMVSNILIEALILNRSIIRYMIGYKQTDPF